MEFKTYKKRVNLKHCCIVAMCTALILVPIAVNTTRAKYSTSQSVPLTRGVVNYKAYDFKIMAMYQENDSGGYDEITEMPTSGYAINEEESYCYTTTQEEHDDTVSMYTNKTGEHVFGNLKKSSKCYLWFDEYDPYAARDAIIVNATSTTTMPSITGISTATTNTLYTVADDDGTSYMFRGNPSNNWVNFGGYYWRIIRVNGDGTIRMIYNGTDTTSGSQIGASAFNTANNDNAYVGFMYGTAGSSTYEATHANTNDSTMKDALDTWYTSNLLSYASYIDTNAGFCGDRTSTTTSGGAPDGTGGYGTTNTYYGARYRLNTNKTPTLKCTNSNDLFTLKESIKGNKALTYPIGLITADEVVFAGAYPNTQNTSFYLTSGSTYWTMTPISGGTSAFMYSIESTGWIAVHYVNMSNGIRPVINLRSDITLSGTGTTTSPYRVS